MPLLESRHDFIDFPLPQLDRRQSAGQPFRNIQQIHQCSRGRTHDGGLSHQRPFREADPPDSPVRMVSPGIAEVDLPMLNDGVVPVRDVDGPVRSHLHVDGTKGPVGRGDQVVNPGGNIAPSFFTEAETIDAVAPEIRGEQCAHPVLRHVTTGHNFQPTVLGLPRIEPTQNPGGPGRGHPHKTREDIIDSVATSPVRHETLPPVVEDVPPGIHKSLHEHFKPASLRTEVPHSSPQEPPHPVGRLHVAVNVDRLVHPEVTRRTPAKGMKKVVGILCPEPG